VKQRTEKIKRGAIKVTRVETFVVDASWRDYLFVKVTTDNGLVGWGEGTSGKEFVVAEAVRTLADRFVIGMNPFNIEGLCAKFFQVERSLMFSALAAVEMALWDVVGKACGEPVVNLVGGKVRDRVRAYANGWAFGLLDDLPALQKQAHKVVALGFRAMKFDPFTRGLPCGGRELGKQELRKATKRVAAVRKAVGTDVDLMIECNGRFTVGMALETIKALQEFDPVFFEEPIPSLNAASMAWVTAAASALGARVATGEHLGSCYGFQELLSRNAAHVVQPDIGRNGGFLETKKVAAMADACYVSVAPHNCNGPGQHVAHIHLCANIPNFLILESWVPFEHLPWRKDLTRGEPAFVDGDYVVPDSPGWGVEFNESEIRRRVSSPGRPRTGKFGSLIQSR